MAVFSVTIPDDRVDEVAEAFADRYGYEEMIPDPDDLETMIPNPQSKLEFTREAIIRYIKMVLKEHQGGIAAKLAREAKEAELDSIIIS